MGDARVPFAHRGAWGWQGYQALADFFEGGLISLVIL
jgi:hypothetical protein